MDNIIEEFIDLNLINDDILFVNGKVEIKEKRHTVPVNFKTVQSLAFNETKLYEDINKAID